MLDDPSAAAELAAIEDWSDFTAAALAAARRLAVELRAADLTFESPRQQLQRPRPPASSGGWLPTAVALRGSAQVVDWTCFGARRLLEPFFEDSAALARHSPLSRLLRVSTPLEALADRPEQAQAPRGLIFHMSRCGSTLVAQMLATSNDNVVVSEAPSLDAVVRLAPPDGDDEHHVALVRAMAAALGRPRAGERSAFLKLDCWHALALPLLRRAFPDTPWVFVYRDPLEVMLSHARRPGSQMIPSLVAPALFGIEAPDGAPGDNYRAQVLGAICEGALRGLALGGGRLVNYRDLPSAVFEEILPHFGVSPDAAAREAMQARSSLDAKAPIFGFDATAEPDGSAAAAEIREACERRLGDVYRRLEAARARQPAA